MPTQIMDAAINSNTHCVHPLPKLPIGYKPSVDANGYQFKDNPQLTQLKADVRAYDKEIDVSLIPF